MDKFENNEVELKILMESLSESEKQEMYKLEEVLNNANLSVLQKNTILRVLNERLYFNTINN